MKQPKIFCIIPFYNTQDFLKPCIQSAINQTYKNLEIILVDDGSTDNSLKLAKAYSFNPRITLIELNKNYGVSVARNIALDLIYNKKKGGGWRI